MSRTIAFFGATGGVANSALAQALKDGNTCTALARNPQKLSEMLTTTHAIPESTVSKHLTIIKGDSDDIPAISRALTSPLDSKYLVDTIVSGMGSLPKMQMSLIRPVTLQQPMLCYKFTTNVFSALEQLSKDGIKTSADGRKLLFVMVSTTGLKTFKRDVPLAYYHLYHWLLAAPHEDKAKAEELLYTDNGSHIRDCVIVRPTLLTDAEPKGIEKVESGWEWAYGAKSDDEETGPAVGYTIGRKDVGHWLYQRCVVEGGWEGKRISLTY